MLHEVTIQCHHPIPLISISNFFQILPTKQSFWSKGRAHLCGTTSTQSDCHKNGGGHLSALSSRCFDTSTLIPSPVKEGDGWSWTLSHAQNMRISPCTQSSHQGCPVSSTNTTSPGHRQQNVDLELGKYSEEKKHSLKVSQVNKTKI